ncbi:MAG: protoporphyrinogen oxidase [Actinophytocola sp.]|nr:protoporphyrinogen oxidase [Actinophytocola sp.]
MKPRAERRLQRAGLRVAVVGGGVSGWTAAYRLRALLGPTAAITVYEGTEVIGGKLRTVELDGVPCDVGAEAFLVRRPEAVALIEELGLGAQLASPTCARATVRAGGHTVRLPTRTLMGVPADAADVADVLSAEGAATVAAEPQLPPLTIPAGDISLGKLVRERLGDEIVDRLVDPLLGGVYAGGADALGLRAVLPALADALDAGAGSLTAAAGYVLPTAANPAPVFGTLRGGLSALIEELAAASGAETHLGAPVRELRPSPEGWTLTLAPETSPPATLTADAVLLAVPAPAARRLLDGVAPAAAQAFAEVELASMAVVALTFGRDTELPDASGVLIGAGERHDDGTPFTAKAFTFSSRKWQHYADRGVFVRGSVGRFGDQEALRATDDELIRRVRADLAELTGITAPPATATVRRWGGGLPQYTVGHLERVARIERAVSELPRFEIAGATLHGVGIPACIATADAAARRLAHG